MTHYECLRVDPNASLEEIRAAYRRAARDAHPDRHGDGSAQRMASVNEAWRVLGDADRRRIYDASLRGSARTPLGSAAGRPAPGSSERPTVSTSVPGPYEPARFPWRFMLVLATLGIGIVMLGVIFGEEPKPVPPDNILRAGDCVTLSAALEAAEVSCTGPHDATVQVLVAFEQTCPTGTESYRDRQGMGNACVIRVVP